MRGEKEKSVEKKFALVANFFCGQRIWLIWLGVFLARVNREEKSQVDRLNRRSPAENKRKMKTKKSLWSDHKLFIGRPETDRFVFSSQLLVLNIPNRPINVTFFFTVRSLYEYDQSNQCNTRDRKKHLCNKSKLFLFNALLFFSHVCF